MNSSNRPNLFALLGFLTLCYGVGFAGSEGTLRGLSGWYQVMSKPEWAPPPSIFVPIWAVMSGLIGFAGWFVWSSSNPTRWMGLVLFGAQLVLAAGWNWLFFSLHFLFASSVVMGVLWILVGLMGVFFFRASRVAGALVVPYLLWFLFAASLNYSVWKLSKDNSAVQVISISQD